MRWVCALTTNPDASSPARSQARPSFGRILIRSYRVRPEGVLVTSVGVHEDFLRTPRASTRAAGPLAAALEAMLSMTERQRNDMGRRGRVYVERTVLGPRPSMAGSRCSRTSAASEGYRTRIKASLSDRSASRSAATTSLIILTRREEPGPRGAMAENGHWYDFHSSVPLRGAYLDDVLRS